MAASLTSAVGATATAVIKPEKTPKTLTNGGAASELAGVPHTVYDDVDPAVYLGPRGVELQLRNSKGLRLQSYLFPAKNAKAVLIFVHGHGSHALFELEPVEVGRGGRGAVRGAPGPAWLMSRACCQSLGGHVSAAALAGRAVDGG